MISAFGNLMLVICATIVMYNEVKADDLVTFGGQYKFKDLDLEKLRSQWSDYKVTYYKVKGGGFHVEATIGSKTHDPKFDVFQQRARLVNMYNQIGKAKGWKFTTTTNEFSTETNAEFVKKRCGFDSRADDLEKSVTDKTSGTQSKKKPYSKRGDPDPVVPDSIDWSDSALYNAVSPVKSQLSCGCCYAFAAIGALESHWIIYGGGKKTQLSEQQLVDCSKAFGTNHCTSGTVNQCYRYIKDLGGINSMKDYPFNISRTDFQCRYKQDAPGQAKVYGYGKVKRDDEEDMKRVVGTIGPVATAMNATLDTFILYKSGIYNDERCGEGLDHGVVIVGYGTENGVDYWKVKNSCGNRWGDKGYFKILRGKKLCSIARSASYPIVVPPNE